VEHPDSWSPLTKAVAEAAKKFHKIYTICVGPEPLEIKAGVMADALVESGTIAVADKARARGVIQQALEDHRKAMEKMMAGSSMEMTVTNALVAAKLAA